MKNLLLRVAVAAAGIPLLLYIIRSGSWLLQLLVVALQAVALLEWRALWRARGAAFPMIVTALTTAALDLAVFAHADPAAVALAVLGWSLVLSTQVSSRQRQPLLNLGAAALYLLYIAAPLALWAVLDQIPSAIRFAPAGGLITLLVATWMCDSGAYFTGRSLGRHKLYPAASPNKTVEGFVGGVAAAAVVVPAFAVLGWNSPTPLDYAAIPIIVGLLGQNGDLLESLMKREAGIKDTSTLLPGHGGILDRFDSMLLSTLFFFVYLLLTSP